MPYVTATEIRNATSNLELAQVATPRERKPITAEQMRKAIDGDDYSGDPDASWITLALGKVNRAVQDASDFLDNYMRLRYAVPLVSPPSTVREIVIRIARYMLHNERATKEVEERYKEAVKWCRDIAEGIIVLDVPAASVLEGDAPLIQEGAGLYTVEGLSDFASWPSYR